MSKIATGEQAEKLVLEYALDASPEKVWRAISIPAFRERWLPGAELADAEPVSTTAGEEASYRIREPEPPFLESIVTFQVRSDTAGGTILRVVHGLADKRLASRPPAANSNTWLMRAA